MNKFGMVMSLAAAAAITGCLDPNYRRPGAIAPVPIVEETAAVEPDSADPAVVESEIAEAEPQVVEEVPAQPVEVKPEPPAPTPEPEYTVYIVQNGDALSKIAKKYSLKVADIKTLNGMKDDRILAGQKIKLPGRVEVGEQKMPEPKKSAPKAKSAVKSTTVYKGAVKEYVVKSGDTLGGIAYSNGINIRQLKALNKLTSDNLRIGQKLQIPAEKVVAEKSKAPAVSEKAAAPVVTPSAPTEEVAVAAEPEPAATVEPAAQPVEAAPAAAVEATEAPAPVAESAETYVVQEDDEVMSIAVRFNVSSSAIRELNNLGEEDQLKAGMVLKLPPDASEAE